MVWNTWEGLLNASLKDNFLKIYVYLETGEAKIDPAYIILNQGFALQFIMKKNY